MIFNKLNVSQKILSGFGILVIIFLVSSYITWGQLEKLNKSAHQAALIDAPLALASVEIKYLLTRGHLELEELLGGDDTQSLKKVINTWSEAIMYAKVILNGGELKGYTYAAENDPAMKQMITLFLQQVEIINKLATERVERLLINKKSVTAGSKYDQQFDVKFEDAIHSADEIENHFVKDSHRSSQHVTDVFSSVKKQIIFSIFIMLFSSIIISLIFSNKVIAQPLKLLTNATNNAAQGFLNTFINVQSKDEFGVLSNSFNVMIKRLNELVSDVKKTGIQLSSSANTMAATAKEQEASAKEQEATSNQIMASSREIALTSKDLANNMDEVARVVDDTAELAEQGRDGLSRMGNTIGQMVDASHNISSKLAVLNEKASNITSVVTTINKVADQTNLLSVNAAIEADKAGEYGIGFGTVATEIRRLADQTAVATYDIEEMVKEMQSAVSAGVMGMEKFSDEVRRGVEDTQQVSEQLSQIVEQVQALAPHFESVHEGMHSQSQGAEQIQNALVQLSETIRGMNDSLRQSNTVVLNLNTESDRLQSAVSEFKLETEINVLSSVTLLNI